MSPNQIESRSRSAASPDLPTAMTTRPQLGSSPAMAVLTSGELAMEKPMRRAAASLSAPVTSMVTNLVSPSPSFTTCQGQLVHQIVQRGGERRPSRARRVRRYAARRAPAAAPVANSSTVSLVEVSLSMVMQLKVCRRPAASMRLQRRLRDGRVGEDVDQHRRQVRRDHAGALGEAVDDHVRRRRAATLRVASLGKVSVVMMARAASCQRVGAGRPGEPVEQMRELAGIERLADHARRGDVDLLGRAADRLGGGLRRDARRPRCPSCR